MKKIYLLAIVALTVVLTGCTLPWQKDAPVSCTMEAKICSDGSAVGRTGPNCEFTECPAPKLCSDGTVCKVTSTAQIANPAAVNCESKGGTSLVKYRGDGGQYALCYFEDNRACEEWAMFRGECPVGGVKTTGYNTEAQRYCAWSGGSTLAVANAVCKFKDGSQCNADAYYNGTCLVGGNPVSFDGCGKISKYSSQSWYPNFAKSLGIASSEINDACLSLDKTIFIVLTKGSYCTAGALYKYNIPSNILTKATVDNKKDLCVAWPKVFGKRTGDVIALQGMTGDAGCTSIKYYDYSISNNTIELKKDCGHCLESEGETCTSY